MILVQLSLLIVIENTSRPIFLVYSVRERCAKKNQQQHYILVCDVSQISRWFSWSSQKDAKQDFAICENMACKEIHYKL
jgi:hypothetical protein